ncbi:UNVERIFIED_CONTAM: hypothetical protein FKN15_047137 [Acipenser sinensis]
MATSKECDALSLTNLVLSELTNVGLSTENILSQCYDGASVMSGKHGGMQKVVQDKLNREVPYVHCFNHQLHLVVVHAMPSEGALDDFSPGHLATVSVIMKSLDSIIHLLKEIENTRTYGTEVRLEAVGLLKAVSKPSFRFIAFMVHKFLSLLDPPKKLLQAEATDLYTGIRVVRSAHNCMEKLQHNSEFDELWEKYKDMDTHAPSKRQRVVSSNLKEHVVETTVGQQEEGNERECKRVFFSTLDAVLGEMSARFNERNSQLVETLCALHPESETFMDVEKVKPLLDLISGDFVEAEFTVARQFLQTEIARSGEEKWTRQSILDRYSGPLTAMPTVMMALKLGLPFGASMATCENSFSTLKNIFSEHRRSMLHRRKAQLIQLAFERDLTSKFRGEWPRV